MSQVISYRDCHSGISGDMFLGAVLDLEVVFSLDSLKAALAALPLQGYQLKLEPSQDKGIRGSRFDVALAEHDATLLQTRHRSDIAALLHASTRSPRVRSTALTIFQCLAEAEAAVHGTAIEEVHFHEVGAIDAIVDIVGAAIAIEALGITQFYASPLPLTGGILKTSPGILPSPPPSTIQN